MNKQQLQLAPALRVPAAIAARTVFITGTKGSGKTHNAGVMAEEMLAAGVHVLILDPLGAWYGLRSDAKGGPGGYPVVILGGEHADAPLLPTSGEIVAEYVVRSGQSVILDMSGFGSNADQDRFVTALLAKLFRLKASEKSALHLIIDEADMFAPERPMSQTEIPLLGATKTIVTKGRSRGLSMTLITQRPQSIAKAAIEEADVVLCHRMQGVNAVKAMRAWTDLYATKEQAETFYSTLPTLADGECWVWSPQFLKLFERHQFRRKNTFDSSRTPDPGEVARKPKGAAAVDLAKLTTEMKATAEQAKANDPAELKRQLAAAKADLAKAQAVKPAPAAKVEQKIVEKPVLKDGQLARVERIQAVEAELIEKLQAVQVSKAEAMKPIVEARAAVGHWRVPVPAPSARSINVPRPPSPARPTSPPAEGVTKAQQKVLDSLAWWSTLGEPAPSRGQVAFMADYTVNGHFNNLLGSLRTAAMVDYPDGGAVGLTEAGRAAASWPAAPGTLADLHEAIRKKLSAAQVKLFDAVAQAYPNSLSAEDLAAAAGYTVNGHFNNMVGSLRSLGLFTKKQPIGGTELMYPVLLVEQAA